MSRGLSKLVQNKLVQNKLLKMLHMTVNVHMKVNVKADGMTATKMPKHIKIVSGKMCKLQTSHHTDMAGIKNNGFNSSFGCILTATSCLKGCGNM